jgi:hypothetical protein
MGVLNEHGHISQPELHRFADGDMIDEAEIATIVKHFETCGACRTALYQSVREAVKFHPPRLSGGHPRRLRGNTPHK